MKSRQSQAIECKTQGPDLQQFPVKEEGPLGKRLNGNLSRLKRLLEMKKGKGATVYCYVVSTIKFDEKKQSFLQKGSAPNFQGDQITLCTCKHQMRARLSKEDWKDKWVAGFTGVRAVSDKNILVYLVKVDRAFQSNLELFRSSCVPAKTKREKSAVRSRFGDLFEPKKKAKANDGFSPGSYRAPHKKHVHFKNHAWHRDIKYVARGGRKPALLIGDPECSLLWSKPMISFQNRLPRDYEKYTIAEFIKLCSYSRGD